MMVRSTTACRRGKTFSLRSPAVVSAADDPAKTQEEIGVNLEAWKRSNNPAHA
jgi:hypothetical protein